MLTDWPKPSSLLLAEFRKHAERFPDVCFDHDVKAWIVAIEQLKVRDEGFELLALTNFIDTPLHVRDLLKILGDAHDDSCATFYIVFHEAILARKRHLEAFRLWTTSRRLS